jgi:hypothetical protein
MLALRRPVGSESSIHIEIASTDYLGRMASAARKAAEMVSTALVTANFFKPLCLLIF